MRSLHALVLLGTVALGSPALAQGVPPDTLDWHRYYPLAVGNVWEYHDAECDVCQFRHALLSDTTVAGRRYYRRVEHVVIPAHPDTIRWVTYDYLRYDTAGYVVAVPAPAADTTVPTPCAGDPFERPLRLGFGARVACPPGSWGDSLRADGAYGGTWTPEVLSGTPTPVEVAAVKWLTVDWVLFSGFVADIGPVASGNLWGPRLHYARVGGVEYGTPEMTVAAEPPPAGRAPALTVAPNPTRGAAAVTLTLPEVSEVRLAVYDVLGRAVAVLHEGPLPAGTHRIGWETGALAPGLYLVRAVGGSAATVRLVVSR